MWYLNYLENTLKYLRKTLKISLTSCRRITVNNGVDFGAMPASAQIGMRRKPVTQSNGVVVRKSSIRKLPNRYARLRVVTQTAKQSVFLRIQVWRKSSQTKGLERG